MPGTSHAQIRWWRVRPALACLFCILLLALVPSPVHADDPFAGNAPANPGPHAHLSGAMTPATIRRAAAKVAAWQYQRVKSHDSLDWTFAPLYLGFIDASRLLHDPRYAAYVRAAGEHLHWGLGPRVRDADDQAVAQAWLALYASHPEPAMLEPLRTRFDRRLHEPRAGAQRPLWWWCDALFMGPPVWAGLSAATHDPTYLAYMNRQWWTTSRLLYDPRAHLFSRDASYLHKHEANGRKVFWSRGNGWVMAGLARVLSMMPRDYPDRPRYLRQFRQMSAAVAAIQGKDGLWRSGLLDAAAYTHPEVSGSALMLYAIAWGVRHGILDRAAYLPIVAKGWRGLVSQIYASGRLGNVQPIGAAPGDYPPGSSYVYGVGAFLMTAREVAALAAQTATRASSPDVRQLNAPAQDSRPV
ncbi:MAG TPA: glycoside hydrolase family 88 protein [Rhodanobacteraceae bacterium]